MSILKMDYKKDKIVAVAKSCEKYNNESLGHFELKLFSTI